MMTVSRNAAQEYRFIYSKFFLFSLLSVVMIDFVQLSYVVEEGDGQVEVCAVLTGQTERNTTVTISAQSDTASGIKSCSFCLIFK